MASITLELSPEVEARVDLWRGETKGTPEELLSAALLRVLEDWEDAREAQRVVAEIDAGRMKTRSWGKVRERLGLDD